LGQSGVGRHRVELVFTRESVERFDGNAVSAPRPGRMDPVTEPSDPTNPLAGRSGYTVLLLQELSDTEIAQHCEYWAARRERYRIDGDGYAGWQASKILSIGQREARRRGLNQLLTARPLSESG
jgi:hypothetical protein